MRPLATTLSLVFALLAGACTSSEGAGQSSTSAPPSTDVTTPVSEETGTEAASSPEPIVETLINFDGQTIEVVVLPSDLLDAVHMGVETGQWTEADGVSAALEGTYDPTTAVDGLRVDDVEQRGLTGLLRRAQELLETDITTDETDRLLRATAPFIFSSSDLDQIRETSDRSKAGSANESEADNQVDSEEGAGETLTVGFARATKLAPECERLQDLAFDEGDIDDQGKCYDYESTLDNAGNGITVYFPEEWRSDPGYYPAIDITLKAAVKSNDTYAPLATVGDLHIVFSLSLDAESESTFAFQTYFDLSDSCPIGVHTPMLFDSNPDEFRQVIAHEIFHCVQDRSFTTRPYSAHAWWMEGSADYFSNVVYPSTNLEHETLADFDRASRTKSVTELTYENSVFFQFYTNQFGDPATIALLQSVSAAGGSLSALQAVDGMEQTWQTFTVAFVAGKITDTGGGALPQAQYWNQPLQLISDEGHVELEVLPFRATRYLVNYKQENLFVQEVGTNSPNHNMVLLADRANLGAWAPLPPEVRARCAKDEKYVIVTTSIRDIEIFDIDVTKVEEAPCDACVLGGWELRLETFTGYLNAIFAASDVPGQLDSLEGSYTLTFDENSETVSRRQPLIVTISHNGFTAPPIQIEGTESGTYTADGTVIQLTNISGSAIAGPAGGSLFAASETFISGYASGYECGDDILTIFDSALDPLVLDRIDPALMPVDPVEIKEAD